MRLDFSKIKIVSFWTVFVFACFGVGLIKFLVRSCLAFVR